VRLVDGGLFPPDVHVFPTPPRGHPWPPRAAANLTQLPSVSLPFLSPRHHQPLRLYIERPPRPDPLRKLRANVLSSYHPARRPQLPEQPPWPPSTLCLHSFLPLAASAPRRRGRYTRNHVHTSNFRFRYPKCFLCTCTYAFHR